MVVVFLAEGFEEVEALAPVDVMRRAGLAVKLAGVTGREVTGSHGICVQTDMAAQEVDATLLEAMVLPGGLPGTRHKSPCPRSRGGHLPGMGSSRPNAPACKSAREETR